MELTVDTPIEQGIEQAHGTSRAADKIDPELGPTVISVALKRPEARPGPGPSV